MSSVSIPSFSFSKKNIQLLSSNSLKSTPFHKIPMKKFATPKHGTRIVASFTTRLGATDPNPVAGGSPPEFPTAPPAQEPSVIPEVPQSPGVPDFDPIPSENPADPPPLSPGSNPGPEFPGPPNPSPPIPDAPRPPIPSQPSEPEVIPPRGPDVVPPKPPEPGPPYPNQPDIPPPIMGSNGLVFY